MSENIGDTSKLDSDISQTPQVKPKKKKRKKMTLNDEIKNLNSSIINSRHLLFFIFFICSMSVCFIVYANSRNGLIAVLSLFTTIIVCFSLVVFWLKYKEILIKRKYRKNNKYKQSTNMKK